MTVFEKEMKAIELSEEKWESVLEVIDFNYSLAMLHAKGGCGYCAVYGGIGMDCDRCPVEDTCTIVCKNISDLLEKDDVPDMSLKTLANKVLCFLDTRKELLAIDISREKWKEVYNKVDTNYDRALDIACSPCGYCDVYDDNCAKCPVEFFCDKIGVEMYLLQTTFQDRNSLKALAKKVLDFLDERERKQIYNVEVS